MGADKTREDIRVCANKGSSGRERGWGRRGGRVECGKLRKGGLGEGKVTGEGETTRGAGDETSAK